MIGYLISWVLYNFWIIYLFLYIKSHTYKTLKSKQVGFIIFLILFLLIVFGEFSGDFRNYKEILDQFSMTDAVATNFEPFYIWLSKATGYNITIFRTIIGIIFLIAIYGCFKIYQELNLPAIFLFTLIPFYYFSNTIRQGLSNSFCLLGLFYLFHNRKKALSFFLIISSFFLHKSSFLVLPALSFLLIPLTRRNLKLCLIALLPIIYIENKLLLYFTNTLLGDGVIAVYMNATSENSVTFLMKVMNFMVLTSVTILSYISLKRIYKKKIVRDNRPLDLITRLLFGCYYMYIVYDSLNLDLNHVSGRFIPFMYVPLVIVIMKAYGIKVLNNQLVLSMLLLFFISMNLQIYRWFLYFS